MILNKMAERITQPQLLEYQSALEGAIPLQAARRAYDRLDAITIAARKGMDATQTALRAQEALLAPGDEAGKTFLNQQFQAIQDLRNSAVEEGNIPGYARSIQNQIRELATDSRYAMIQQNAKDIDAFKKQRDRLVAQGLTPLTVGEELEDHQSIDANGNPRRFTSFIAQEPDYKKAHQGIFSRAGTDVLESEANLREYVLGEDLRAVFAYQGTPQGRIEQDQIAKAMFNKTHDQLVGNELTQVQDELAKRIYNDALPLVDVPDSARRAKLTGRFKGLEGKGVVIGSPDNVMIGDGSDAPDQSIQELSDMDTNSRLDEYLMLTYGPQADQIEYDGRGGTRKREIAQGEEVESVVLTGGFDRERNVPMIRVYTTRKDSQGGSTSFVRPMNEGDLSMLQGEFQTVLASMEVNETPSETRRAAMPIVQHIYAPEAGNVLYGEDGSADLTEYGVRLVRQEDTFRLIDIESGKVLGANNQPFIAQGDDRYDAAQKMESFLGAHIYDYLIARM